MATLAVGFAWGVGIGLVQLLPGWSFINFSQRSKVNYAFFGAGSLAVRWTALLFTPDLFGGNGALRPAGLLRQLQPGRGDRLRRGAGPRGGRGVSSLGLLGKGGGGASATTPSTSSSASSDSSPRGGASPPSVTSFARFPCLARPGYRAATSSSSTSRSPSCSAGGSSRCRTASLSLALDHSRDWKRAFVG